MNERVTYPMIITLICLVAAAGLAFTFAVTKDRIEESKKSEFNKALEIVLPRGKIEPLDEDKKVYVAREAGNAIGYAATGEATGYSSKIKVMVGVRPNMEIIAIKILDQQETPGLGEQTKHVPPTKTIWKAVGDPSTSGEPEREPPFQKQFRAKKLDQLVLTKEPPPSARISQLTGATITSQAIVNAVRDAIKTIEKVMRQPRGDDNDGKDHDEDE